MRSSAKIPKKHKSRKSVLFLLLVAIIFVVWYFSSSLNSAEGKQISQYSSKEVNKTSQTVVTKPNIISNVCSSNIISQNIIVSISQRHLWACTRTEQVYNTAAITGNMDIAADVTPLGTYEIYSKQTDLYLKGTDGVTSWDDHVNYWMPFLDNNYGVYGLHDATWRTSTDFGNINPYSSQASHGCVELPLTAASWLYNWAAIGATVTIQT